MEDGASLSASALCLVRSSELSNGVEGMLIFCVCNLRFRNMKKNKKKRKRKKKVES